MHSVCHGKGIPVAVGVVGVRAERKQCFDRLDQFRALPALRHRKIEQRRAVASGRLQIWQRLRRLADCLLIVLYDGVGDGEQRRLITKVPFP